VQGCRLVEGCMGAAGPVRPCQARYGKIHIPSSTAQVGSCKSKRRHAPIDTPLPTPHPVLPRTHAHLHQHAHA
jgi:hypothetical protein